MADLESPRYEYGFLRKRLKQVTFPIIAGRTTSIPTTMRSGRRRKIEFNESDIFSNT